jgi:PKD repeat protein
VPQAPFPAVHLLPCTVEAEQFDVGGEGVAYHDYDAANLGTNAALRPGEGVDIDTGGGVTNVAYTRDGEYLKYSVDTASAGGFALSVRAANPDPAVKVLKVYLDGAPAGQVSVGATGSWTAYGDFASSAPLAVPAGRHVVTLAFEDTTRINLDRLVFTVAAPTPTPTTIAPTTTAVPTTMVTPPPIGMPTPTPEPTTTVEPELQNATLPAFAGAASSPSDPDDDGRYEDVNGNGRTDFADVTIFFNNLDTVATTHPADAFDFNINARIDFGDVGVLYAEI